MENKPFFMFNPKSYLFGSELVDLALIADEIARLENIKVFVTAPYTDIAKLSSETKNIIVTSQHLDSLDIGRGMGYAVPEALYNAGARATVLNHAEHPLSLNELKKSISRAKNLSMSTIACANSLIEATAIAKLSPDVILCEPDELIGTGKTSDDTYIEETSKAIKEIDAQIGVMQGAGVRTPNDVSRLLKLGADGVGCTSGIVKSNDPKNMLKEMILRVRV